MIFSWQDGDDSGMNRFGSGLNRLGSLQLHRHPHNRPWMYQASDLAVHGSSLAVDDKEGFISGSHHVVAEDPRCCYRAVRVFPLRQRRLHSFPNTGHHFYFAWRQNTKDKNLAPNIWNLIFCVKVAQEAAGNRPIVTKLPN